MTPFSTTAIREHLLTHISQVVGISSRLAVGASFFENGFRRGTDAATVAPTAPPAAQVRNRLRFIEPTTSREQICSVLNCSARLLAAGLRLQRVGSMSVQESRHITQLVFAHMFGQDLAAMSVLSAGEIALPLSLRLV